jgi:hypothetical protein
MIAAVQIRSIFAFTFGNRMLANGSREAGPVNEALAAVAIAPHRATGAPIFAQWEVAAAIGGRAGGACVSQHRRGG